jgi:type IV pilus assembly protein PilV
MLIPAMSRLSPYRLSRGVSMLEVLIAIGLLTVGLLGVAQLQFQMQTAELEAYQRTQAIVLLQDMVDRINANRKNAAQYATAAPLGTASTIDCSAPATLAERDQCDWHTALLGANETRGGAQLGAMNGARGCITNPVTSMPRQVIVSVAWQGVSPTAAPGATACGQGDYGSDDRFRRAMVASVTIACLENDPSTGACVTP